MSKPVRLQTFISFVRQALANLLENNPEALIFGEDVQDPFGGAFKATEGLSTKYQNRVFNTPISEASIVGLGAGLALSGHRPIVEIMYGDFLTLCADQIINHAAKFSWMYGNDMPVPLMIRTASGAGKAYGPTHSQSLENLFLGVPNLEIWSPFIYNDLDFIYKEAFLSDIPSIVVEAKALYPVRVQEPDFLIDRLPLNGETLVFSNCKGETPDVTIMSHGRMAYEIYRMMEDLFEDETFVELYVFSKIYPVDSSVVLRSIKKTGRLLVVEESSQSHGWGRYVSGQLYDNYFSLFKSPIHCLGCTDTPIGSSLEMEEETLPNPVTIKRAIKKLIT